MAAFADATAKGLPVVHGEVIEGDTAGYHYYPEPEQVLAWLDAEGLDFVDEGYRPGRRLGISPPAATE